MQRPGALLEGTGERMTEKTLERMPAFAAPAAPAVAQTIVNRNVAVQDRSTMTIHVNDPASAAGAKQIGVAAGTARKGANRSTYEAVAPAQGGNQ
jgi:hypothetical protein